jgi:hydrogenase/urease accessory protein HupE
MAAILLIALTILICLAPSSADAHMVWAGGGAFWAGFLHPLTSLDEICFLVSLSIWSTFNKLSTRLWVLGTIGAVTTAAAVILWWSGQELSTIPAMATLMIVTGLGGATRFKVQSVVLVPLAAIGAWFIGSETGQAVGGLSPVGFIIGASLSPTMLFLYLLMGLERLRLEWQSIASRAVASWIAAIGIMMLTFELARHRFPMQPH